MLPHIVALVFLLLAGISQAAELDDINLLADQGKTTQALERLNSYLQSQPKDAKALFLKGVVQVRPVSVNGQRACGGASSVSMRPSASRSAPAQAIMAPLSVHSSGSG